MKAIFVLITIILTLTTTLEAARKALVIGNAAYDKQGLKNPLNDADDIANALKKVNYSVSLHKNLDKQGFDDAVSTFRDGIVPSDEVLFYFSGHGAQIDGVNYLIPVGENIDSAARCKSRGFNALELVDELSGADIAIIILDACRDNPFKGYKSFGKKGLASIQGKPGSQYIIYAAAENCTAEDGAGRNSPFAASLVKHISTSRKPLEAMMRDVTNEVAYTTQEGQIPWTAGNLRNEFRFHKFLKPIEMVYVEGGSFIMGSDEREDDERPAHRVQVPSFYIGKYEISESEWIDVMGSLPGPDESMENLPVVVVWYDAIEYCNNRSTQEALKPCYTIDMDNKDPDNDLFHDQQKYSVSVDWSADGYRLPTEAEWEYAARGGAKSKGFEYSGSNEIEKVAWYHSNSVSREVSEHYDYTIGILHACGTKAPNELGIYDMSGNAWEHCYDKYDSEYYNNRLVSNPFCEEAGGLRVIRGGDSDSLDDECHVTKRESSNPFMEIRYVGFRVVRNTR